MLSNGAVMDWQAFNNRNPLVRFVAQAEEA